MDERNNLDAYNGDTVHDMYVDYDHHINTGELADEFGDSDIDDFRPQKSGISVVNKILAKRR